MRALLSPGDRVICMFPGYQSLYSIAQSMGCQVDLWEPELSSSGQGEGSSGQQQGQGQQGPALTST